MSDATARHILVVDDDDRLRRLLQRYLTEHGYHVSTAADADEAKASLKNFAFDLMVLDVMLPGQNGISLTNELRGQVDLPILLLTALGESDDRVNGLAAGADDYLVKPFDPRELLLRIATILRRATPPAPSPGPLRFGPFTFDTEGRSCGAARSACISRTPSCRCCRCWPSSPAYRSVGRNWAGAAGSAAPIGRSTPRSPGSGASWNPIPGDRTIC